MNEIYWLQPCGAWAWLWFSHWLKWEKHRASEREWDREQKSEKAHNDRTSNFTFIYSRQAITLQTSFMWEQQKSSSTHFFPFLIIEHELLAHAQLTCMHCTIELNSIVIHYSVCIFRNDIKEQRVKFNWISVILSIKMCVANCRNQIVNMLAIWLHSFTWFTKFYYTLSYW